MDVFGSIGSILLIYCKVYIKKYFTCMIILIFFTFTYTLHYGMNNY